MEMKCEILGPDERLEGVVKVRVPGIYGIRKGNPLPKRLAKLVRPAAEALARVYEKVVAEGGHLYMSDMFRSAAQQQRAHEDWKSGRKTAFSPPSCGSVHEAARAIDIDAFDTGIGHRRVREILNEHGWVNIVETLTGAECWHYEFRQERWEEFKQQHGYKAMAAGMKEEIGNRVGASEAERRKTKTRRLQRALNILLDAGLEMDGIFGEQTREAVKSFQEEHGLQVDGVAGPRTLAKIEELLPVAEVKWLQRSLNRILGTRLRIDGDYGAKTRAAVSRFQEQFGLEVDGKAGPVTEGKIWEVLAEG